jgi:hypothetical protein
MKMKLKNNFFLTLLGKLLHEVPIHAHCLGAFKYVCLDLPEKHKVMDWNQQQLRTVESKNRGQ